MTHRAQISLHREFQQTGAKAQSALALDVDSQFSFGLGITNRLSLHEPNAFGQTYQEGKLHKYTGLRSLRALEVNLEPDLVLNLEGTQAVGEALVDYVF